MNTRARSLVPLDDLLRSYPRIALAGGPRTGKTTLASLVTCRPVHHTDDLMHLAWEEVPHAVIRQVATLPRFLVEGVQIPRALRKGLVVDAVLWLQRVYPPTTPKHRQMASGIRTIFDEWRASSPVPVFTPSLFGSDSWVRL